MSTMSAAYRKMVAAGMSVDDIADMLDIIERGFSKPVTIVPDALLKRRAYDREYRREKRMSGGCRTTSDDSDESTRHPPDIHPTSAPLAHVRDNLLPTVTSGKKKEERPQRGSRLADDWLPSEVDQQFALKEGLALEEIGREIDGFRDYWRSVAGSRGCKLDWSATWRNRVRDVAGRKRERAAQLAARTHPSGNGQGASFLDLIAERRLRGGG